MTTIFFTLEGGCSSGTQTVSADPPSHTARKSNWELLRHAWSWSILALLVVTLALAAGCDRTAKIPDPPQPLAIVISADTAGWITPCGCTSNQSGGLPRRGSYLANLRQRSEALYADAGGAAAPGASEYQKVKFEAILAGEMKMGLCAHNLGRSEAAFGPDYLREAGRRLGAPFVSANVFDSHGRLVAEPIRIASSGGARIAFVGVMSPAFADAGIRVNDPRRAVQTAAAGAKGQYDYLVVLAYLPQNELEALAGNLPEADAIVGGPTGQPIQPRQVGPTLLASCTNKGKFLVELNAAPGKPGASTAWSGKIVEMGATLPDQPDQSRVIESYLAELGRRDLTADQTGLVAPLPPGTPAGYRIAGSAACAACHAAENAAWRQSGHASAWKTLVSKRFDVDPSCMQCHTTGFGLPGGFESRGRSINLVSVGCEDCHGPSQAHAADPKVRTPYLAADRCTTCHDHENSPSFDFNSFWPKIRHGRAGGQGGVGCTEAGNPLPGPPPEYRGREQESDVDALIALRSPPSVLRGRAREGADARTTRRVDEGTR